MRHTWGNKLRNIPEDVAELIKDIIGVDCGAQYMLKNPEGDFCVVGGLYACVNPDWADAELTYHGASTNNVRRKIEDALGLERGTLRGIYRVNDDFSDKLARRRELCAWVDSHTQEEAQSNESTR
jgi:hypothetical protein